MACVSNTARYDNCSFGLHRWPEDGVKPKSAGEPGPREGVSQYRETPFLLYDAG